MALRDVLIKLRLDTSQYKTAIAAASANTKAFAKDTATSAGTGAKSLGLLRGSYATIGLAAGAAGVAAVRAAADFEQGMANVNATGAASASQMHDLRDAALEMGRTTVYSSTEAAGGMEALLKAGLSAKDVIGGGLTGSFNLAAAGELEVAEAAETAASAMAQFSLSGKDVPHIADLLAAGAGKANGDVRDLGQALNQAGLIAAGAGASIEETTGTLAAFAKAGLLGSDAGTSFKTMLQRLQAPSAEAQGLMDKLHISAYDAHGDFVGLAEVAGQLQAAFKGQSAETRSAALATIFGSDAVRAANVLYKEGRSGIKDWTDRVNDAGYAADVAAKKTDTLKGDLDKMKNSWRALAEGAGGDGQGGLRPIVKGLDDMADSIGKVNRGMSDLGEKVFGENRNDSPLQQLRELINTFKAKDLGVSPEVFIKFKTEGSADAIATAAKVANAEGMSDRTVRSVLELIDWSPEGIDAVLTRMNQVDEKQVTSTLELFNYDTDEIDAVNRGLDETDAKHPTPRLDIENLTPEQRKLAGFYGLLKDVDKTNATPTITLETAEAMGKISRLQRAIDTFRNSGDEVGVGTVLARASGGAIVGPGTATSDSVLLRGSDGEHMLTASDVDKMGGQGAVYAFRRALQSGISGFAGGGALYSQPARAYAAGGVVGSSPTSVRTEVGISIRDISFDERGHLAFVRVVATDQAHRVLADQVFNAEVA